MMDIGVILWIVVAGIGVVAALYTLYTYTLRGWVVYAKAKREIRVYVEAYKGKCTGQNRFVCTVETLQMAFVEYETKIIRRVWLSLIDERLIERDPIDQEWCIR